MGKRVLFFPAANERSVLYAGDVVFRRSVQIAIGKKLLVELDDFAGSDRFRAQCVPLRLAAVDPDDFVRAGERRAVFDKFKHFFVVGHHIGYLLEKFCLQTFYIMTMRYKFSHKKSLITEKNKRLIDAPTSLFQSFSAPKYPPKARFRKNVIFQHF